MSNTMKRGPASARDISQRLLDETVPVTPEATPRAGPRRAGADNVRHNPYYGLPGDPYGGEQFIPDGASVINGRPVGASGSPLPGYRQQPPPSGQTIDQYGRRLMEPRSFGSHAHTEVPASVSTPMPANATAATFADHRLSNAAERYHHEHNLARDLAGAAVMAGATYATVKTVNRWVDGDRAAVHAGDVRITAFDLVVLVSPASCCQYCSARPSSAVLPVLPAGPRPDLADWSPVIRQELPGQKSMTRWVWQQPTDAERQAAYEGRMSCAHR